MLKGGLEPPCPLRHMNLNHACLPFHHFSSNFQEPDGGVDRVRTDDPHNAIVMLFQLSYNPIFGFMRQKCSKLRMILSNKINVKFYKQRPSTAKLYFFSEFRGCWSVYTFYKYARERFCKPFPKRDDS